MVAVHAGCSCNVCGCVLCECVWGLCILYTYLHLYHLCTLLEKSYLGVRSEIDIIDIIDINVHSQTDTHTHTHTLLSLSVQRVSVCVVCLLVEQTKVTDVDSVTWMNDMHAHTPLLKALESPQSEILQN